MDGCASLDTPAMKRLSMMIAMVALALPATAQAHLARHAAALRSGLPFASSDLILLVGGCVVLIAVGIVVRQLTAVLDPARRASAVHPDARRAQPGHRYPQPASGR
jgi:hypothetical protein